LPLENILRKLEIKMLYSQHGSFIKCNTFLVYMSGGFESSEHIIQVTILEGKSHHIFDAHQ